MASQSTNQSTQKPKGGALQLAKQNSLPQNRPIAPNTDEKIDDMIGYLD